MKNPANGNHQVAFLASFSMGLYIPISEKNGSDVTAWHNQADMGEIEPPATLRNAPKKKVNVVFELLAWQVKKKEEKSKYHLKTFIDSMKTRDVYLWRNPLWCHD